MVDDRGHDRVGLGPAGAEDQLGGDQVEEVQRPQDRQQVPPAGQDLLGLREDLDPRLARRPTEKLIKKRYASTFKGTNFHELLASLCVDTLIVTGVSTSHCVYATCRDAIDSVRVIVPREAVGERCERCDPDQVHARNSTR